MKKTNKSNNNKKPPPESVLPNANLWFQLSPLPSPCSICPLSRAGGGTGSPFKCLFAFSPNLKILSKYRSNGKLTENLL